MSLVSAEGDILLNSVLIATDFSEASEKALRHALAIARHYGAKLYLLHVVSFAGIHSRRSRGGESRDAELFQGMLAS